MPRIIDLTNHSAAYGARLLAEAGHEVVRVEPRIGDVLRRLGPHAADRLDLEHGPYHMFLNMGKKSLTLQLTLPQGREVFLRLIETADALIATAPLSIEEKLLRQKNSRLVLTILEDELPEICAYARSGLMSITGQPSERPVLAGGHVSYTILGLHVGIAAAAAINVQQSTGQGEVVRVSARQSLESLMEQALIAYTSSGAITRRRGLRGQITSVSGALECADGYWMVSVPPNPQAWTKLKEWVGDSALTNDPSLDDEQGRDRKRDFILDRLEVWSKQWSKEYLVTGAQSRRIAASPITTPAELLQDPQLLERGFLTTVEDPHLGSIAVPRGAISTVRGVALKRAPSLGEHNAEILSQLGYSNLEQQALMENGVL